MLQVVGHLMFSQRQKHRSINSMTKKAMKHQKLKPVITSVTESENPKALQNYSVKTQNQTGWIPTHSTFQIPFNISCLGQVSGLANTVHSKKNNGVYLASKSKGHVLNCKRFCFTKKPSQSYAPRVLRGQRCSQLSQTKAPKQISVGSNKETRHTRHRTTSIDFFGVKSVSMDSCTAI